MTALVLQHHPHRTRSRSSTGCLPAHRIAPLSLTVAGMNENERDVENEDEPIGDAATLLELALFVNRLHAHVDVEQRYLFGISEKLEMSSATFKIVAEELVQRIVTPARAGTSGTNELEILGLVVHVDDTLPLFHVRNSGPVTEKHGTGR